jgi:hypothetical protein
LPADVNFDDAQTYRKVCMFLDRYYNRQLKIAQLDHHEHNRSYTPETEASRIDQEKLDALNRELHSLLDASLSLRASPSGCHRHGCSVIYAGCAQSHFYNPYCDGL